MERNHRRVKLACYTTNISMSAVGNLPPLLFLTFRSLYGISYSLLGLLVLINFSTQLLVDLIFSFFSHKFDIPKTVKMTPAITIFGLLVYALWPYVFPDAVYAGLVIGTVIFSAAAGLVEVLISPVIAALPADDPDREMSKLHSVYAWGVVFVIIVGTLFLLLVGSAAWQALVLLFTLVPLTAFALFSDAKIPEMETPERVSGVLEAFKNKSLLICVLAIFLGGAAECTMAQWSSSYLEQALNIPKVWGDIFGVALFAVMLGLGRTLYAKYGKKISTFLFFGSIGAALCYFIAAISSVPVIGLIACGLTGFCVSMLWPGSLIVVADRLPVCGVFVYALMAAGGDLGASVGPQLVGIITDAALAVPSLSSFAVEIGLSPEQFGMKLGMLTGMIFPLAAIFVYGYIRHTDCKK